MLRNLKKLFSFALAGVLTVALAAPMAHALEYDGSAGYESGKYYRALTEVQLTGDQRVDIVNVALSQVGYQEGGSSTQLSGEVFGGVNFTEYGNWYGMQDMWCAIFASWCAHVADIPTSVIPSHSYTPNGLQWFRDRGLAHEQESVASGAYTPQPGDLIYFRSSRNTNRTNHVGIVTGCEDGMIYTVEGNIGSSAVYSNGGMVSTVSYPITNTYIVAVCSPDYVNSGTNVTDDRMDILYRTIRTVEGGGYDRVSTTYSDTICVGIGQWYGSRALELLLQIHDADEDAFTALDTAGIGEDLENADWGSYQPDAKKTACIRRILGSDMGIRIQDRFLARQLDDYLQRAQENGITDRDAGMLYALLSYLGGTAAADRVLDQIQGDCTPDAILAALASSNYAHLRSAAEMLCQALQQ